VKILVTAKRVTDPEARIRLMPDRSGIVEDDVDYKINPFCENAIEAALELSDDLDDCEVVVVSIGPEECEQYIRTALAMGCDRGIRVEANDRDLDGDLVARILVALFKREEPGLIVLGKQCIDGDSNQVGQLLAAYLGIGQACFASEIELSSDAATVAREVDGGIERIRVKLPAVVTADLRLNEPRYASLPGIMRAKRKPIDELTLDELGVDASIKVRTIALQEPPARVGGGLVADVTELVDKLQNVAKVL